MNIFQSLCPGKPFTLSVCTFLPGVTFQEVCPYRITDRQRNTYETQWQLVAALSDGIHVEFCADITEPLSGFQVFGLTNGLSSKTEPTYGNDQFLKLLDQASVKIHLQDGNAITVPMNFLSGSLVRKGPARKTYQAHFGHQFGGVHAILDYKSNSPSVGLTLNFHNASLPAKKHFYFKGIELLLPQGLDFSESLKYKTKSGTYIVRPDNHMIPERRQFSRRLQIHPVGFAPVAETWGQGFSNYFNGGYQIQGFEVAHLPNAKNKLYSEYNDALNKFENALGEYNGVTQPCPLWQSMDVSYGGATGGVDIENIVDPATVECKDPVGLELLMMKQLRYRNRQKGPILEPNGNMVECENYMNSDQSLPWKMFANEFQSGQDTPFYYSKAHSNTGFSPYEGALLSWAPIDHQHLRRVTAQDQALVWLTNDPLSKIYALQDAELQRMAYWHLKGGAFDLNAAEAKNGTSLGRELAWMLDCVSFGFAIAPLSRHKRNLWDWVRTVVDFIDKVQMPSGWINRNFGGKIASQAPFNNNYGVGQAYESCFIATAILGAHRVLMSPKALDSLEKLLLAFQDYAWPNGKTGPYYLVPTHKKNSSTGNWELLQSIPTDGLMDTVGTETYNFGHLCGIAQYVATKKPGTKLQVNAWFLKNYGAPNAQDALSKIQMVHPDTWPHVANTMALAQKNIGGVSN